MGASVSDKIVLGSRGSELARAQTALVTEALRRSWPDLKITTRIISTRGDVRTAEAINRRAGRKGMFTEEIERALAAGEIDVAVHSAKDLPSEMTAGLEVGAVLPRASVDDVLIRREPGELSGIIATGSVRRRHQLSWKFPRITLVDLRGNVPTRLRKFLASDWQAIVLARAGLERLGFNVAAESFEFEGKFLQTQALSSDDFLPAGGQGIIALQARREDEKVKAVVRAIDHPETFSCLRAERDFLRRLACDCNSPVGVLATINERQEMTLRAQVFEESGRPPKIGKVLRGSLHTAEPEMISAALHSFMYGQG
jgi:hydroxymethylbilane synthase